MRAALALALFLQLGSLPSAGPTAEPKHLLYERTLSLPANAAGQACAVLDAGVFAHALSRSGNDLRLFANGTTETPFALVENEPQPADVETANVRNLGTRNGDIVFDLQMPQRAYTDVTLKLAAKDFVATAKVSGSNPHGGPATDLGSFTLFDLTRQRLSRSTTLTLQESTFAELHVAVHMATIDGTPWPKLSADIVRGASVPPSREAQTLTTVVAETTTIDQRERHSTATLRIPAHVPVERVSFVLDPAYTKNFLRNVTVIARPDSADDSVATENISGEISSVRLPHQQIDVRKLSLDAALGANLSGGATIEVSVDNGDDAPLPIKSVRLEMRQRTICFDAAPATTYSLRYGDATLHAPVYDYARLFQPEEKPLLAALGPEQQNPLYAERADPRPYTERHPELLWIGLLAVVAILGTTALHNLKTQGHKK